MAPTPRSTVLNNDSLIYKVSESIDAVTLYGRLGLALLGNEAEVTNVLGKPIPHFEDAMFKCLYTWRNAQGAGPECEETLMGIFEELGLKDALVLLKEERQKDGNTHCLSADAFLYDLVEKIDCLSNYTQLGTRLLGSTAKAQYHIGLTAPSYTDALYECIRRWRNRTGASTDAYTKLRAILMKHGLVKQAEQMDILERGGQDDVDLPSVPSSPNNVIHPEPEACL